MTRMTLGVIFGNRDFFPDHLVTEARTDIRTLFSELDINGIMLDESATKLGGVETWSDSKLCADLFRRHAGEIDGILVCLPNFGDEKGVADTVKLSGLDVPILDTALGEENTYGAMAGRTPSGPVTFARVSTDDVNGAIRTYVGEGCLPTTSWTPLALVL
jgi:L-fucose isomerase-like protein